MSGDGYREFFQVKHLQWPIRWDGCPARRRDGVIKNG
jgi:hypothetical protein